MKENQLLYKVQVNNYIENLVLHESPERLQEFFSDVWKALGNLEKDESVLDYLGRHDEGLKIDYLNFYENVLKKDEAWLSKHEITYFKGEGGSFAQKLVDHTWQIKKGALRQGGGYKSLEAWDYVQSPYAPEGAKSDIPVYASELGGETYESYRDIQDNIVEVANQFQKEGLLTGKERNTQNYYQWTLEMTQNIFEALDWQSSASYAGEIDWEEELSIYYEHQFNQYMNLDDFEFYSEKWPNKFKLSNFSDKELAALVYRQADQLKYTANGIEKYYPRTIEEESTYFTWRESYKKARYHFSTLSKELLKRNVLTPTIPFITGRSKSEALELDEVLQSLQHECLEVIKQNRDFQPANTPETKFEVAKQQVLDVIGQASGKFKIEVLSETPEHIYNMAGKISYVEDALDNLSGELSIFEYQNYEKPNSETDKQFSAIIDLQRGEGIDFKLFQAAAERSYFKTDGPYVYGEDLDTFIQDYVVDYLELEPYIEKLERKNLKEMSVEQISNGKGLSDEAIRGKDEVWLYDPKDTEEGVPWTKPWHVGNVSDRIKELRNIISEADSDGMIELNEEQSILKDSLEKELEAMVDYRKSGDKAVLPENTFINPKPDDFQKANVKVFGLKQKENLGEFIKEYHSKHPTPAHNNVRRSTQEIGR
ncbi:hypothetical protein AALM99_07490 [Lactococcus muris]|uniref:Uncharacterized protein n=1 Tax=Lactococcus muris TaxID=2941330 RepID=A0ABV4D978_9LACT